MPKKVLAVDDEPSIRRLVTVTLENRGFEVDTAEDGQQALDKIAVSRPDLVVLDVMMPKMTGWEVRQKLRSDPKTADLPILILSAVGEFESQLAGMESDQDDYITKPFRPQELGDLCEIMADPKRRSERTGEHSKKAARLRTMVDIMHRHEDK
jgi:DNA-binding response OmpR family regulator